MTAPVTGGAGGLSQEIAEGPSEAGASLMLLARREQWLAPTVNSLRVRGFPRGGPVAPVG